MGSYTDSLFKRPRTGRLKTSEPRMLQMPGPKAERLVEVAIMLPDGSVIHGFHSHYELRSSHGWDNPSQTQRGTRDGFWTDRGRFVTRVEAKYLGYESGQVQRMERELLSSDVQWEH